ncbi:MAG TPA: hypothetical protein VHJ18_19990 [Streptosporangiaceae bacterium]|jgi:hypothetical protein|nr:hypothetical protein [Streptosporangiaceae bacterium]
MIESNDHRPRVIVLVVASALALGAGACAAGNPAGQTVRHGHSSAVAVPLQRRSRSDVVHLIIAASGDLLIHSPV